MNAPSLRLSIADKKPEQEGYTFFQGPTPKTGQQADLPDFFSSEARAEVTVPPQLAIFGGIAVLGGIAVAAFILLG